MPQAPYTLEQAEEDIATLRGQIAYLGEAGSALNLGLNGLGAQFPATTVTAAALTNIATATYPAANAAAGAVYEIECQGNGSQGSTQQTLQFQATPGGNAGISTTMGALFMAASQAFRWKCRTRFICKTAGSSGTWLTEVEGFICEQGGTFLTSGASSANATNSFFQSSTVVLTMDTTVTQTLALQVAWGATTGAPTITNQVQAYRRVA